VWLNFTKGTGERITWKRGERGSGEDDQKVINFRGRWLKKVVSFLGKKNDTISYCTEWHQPPGPALDMFEGVRPNGAANFRGAANFGILHLVLHQMSAQYKQVAQLSQRGWAAGWVSYGQKYKTEMGDNIYGHYKSIFNHCDVFGQQSKRIRWNTQNKGYYAVQGHSRSPRLVPIESPYATYY